MAIEDWKVPLTGDEKSPKPSRYSLVQPESLSGLHYPFWKMGQGVYLSGEVKETSRSESKKTVSSNSVGLGVKAPEITGIWHETRRSNPG